MNGINLPLLVISIEDVKTAVKEGISKANKPYKIVEQQAYVRLIASDGQPEKYPAKISISLEDGAEPFKTGDYTLSPESFMVGDFGALRIGRLKLVPLPKVAPAK